MEWQVTTESDLIPTFHGMYKDGVATIDFDYLFAKEEEKICNISLHEGSSFYLDRVQMRFIPFQYTHVHEVRSLNIVPIFLNILGVLGGVLVFGLFRRNELR